MSLVHDFRSLRNIDRSFTKPLHIFFEAHLLKRGVDDLEVLALRHPYGIRYLSSYL
jgi:hypothetical protein